MSKIKLLSEEVASQVAAGEVVERPASVVKELVENSLDAGATRIEVLVSRGGISLIRVTDNGSGMSRDDALLCLERHATSKIRTGHDLATVATLGFRGEAIPSIASVSRFTLSTREHDAVSGTEISIAGGKIQNVKEGGDAPGTSIEVRSLFYNLPARRKFLRTENTEAGHIEHQFQLQAIGHPGIGFTLVRDGRTIYQLPPTAKLQDRLRDLYGVSLQESLLPVVGGDEHFAIRIHGFIGKPGVSRSTRVQQIVFINGRAAENTTINYALREGYHTALMKGQYPVTFLFLEMDPNLVDVNVHPTKREVRFRESFDVRDAVTLAIQRTLESNRTSWSQQFAHSDIFPSPPSPQVPAETRLVFPAPPQASQDSAQTPESSPSLFRESIPPAFAPHPAGLPQTPVFAQPEESVSEKKFRILGVLGKLYILMESESGLVLVDQHAAHERILFEELRRRMEKQDVPSQRLLLSHTLDVSPHDRNWILSNLDILQKMGIGLEAFGPTSFKLDSLPAYLMNGDPAQTLRDIIDALREAGRNASKLRLGEDVIATTVCRHAVKANDYLREPELVKLIEDLLACELPYCCPHGRPTMIQMNYYELEKKFGRKV